jgi:hypothetical protein
MGNRYCNKLRIVRIIIIRKLQAFYVMPFPRYHATYQKYMEAFSSNVHRNPVCNTIRISTPVLVSHLFTYKALPGQVSFESTAPPSSKPS